MHTQDFKRHVQNAQMTSNNDIVYLESHLTVETLEP